LAEAKMAQCTEEQQIELILLVVERGIYFARSWDLPESYFDGIVHMFEMACKQIKKTGLRSKFEQKCANTIKDCDIGYGLCELFNIYDIYFP
jgi:hypothetical protein